MESFREYLFINHVKCVIQKKKNHHSVQLKDWDTEKLKLKLKHEDLTQIQPSWTNGVL